MATHSKKQPVEEEPGPLHPGQKRVAPYAPSHASITSETERQERLAMIGHIPENASTAMERLSTTNYHIDRSIREASLAGPDQWQEEAEMLVFTSSDKIKVYLGTPRNPLEISEALKRIRELSESTALTARIVLGLWNIRRANNLLAKEGSIAMRLEEVLEWRGIKKHSYWAHPDKPDCAKRYTDGYAPKHKEQVLKDLDLLASCCVRGRVTCIFRGKPVQVGINGPYLNYSIVTYKTLWSEDAIAGVFISPGAWINAYAEYDNHFLAEVDRRIFTFHPQRQQHELRLALYLTEYWRQEARKGSLNKPIMIANLLAASMIPINYHNLTSRFIPRIEDALQNLWKQGILGAEPKCLNPVDRKGQSQWGRAWLGSQWVLIPPREIQEFYATSLSTPPPSTKLHKSTTRKVRARNTTQNSEESS